MYLSTSLSRFDHVRRRQMLRLKKRSNWFLSPNTSTSMDSESVLGSHKSSMDAATSSDALASDVTASDGGLSDGALRHSSDCSYEDAGSGHLMSPGTMTPGVTPIRGHQPLQRLSHMRQDILNANLQAADTSTPKRKDNNGILSTSSKVEAAAAAAGTHHLHPGSELIMGGASNASPPATPDHLQSSHMPSSRLPAAGALSESDVRFFMVESYYGSPAQHNGDS